MYSFCSIFSSSELCIKIFTSWVSDESALIETVNSSFKSTSSGEFIEISSAEVRLIAIRMVMSDIAFFVKDVKRVKVVVPD